jgi:hypothetical protein
MKQYKVITHLNGKPHAPETVSAAEMIASAEVTTLYDSDGNIVANYPNGTLLSCVELKAIVPGPMGANLAPRSFDPFPGSKFIRTDVD